MSPRRQMGEGNALRVHFGRQPHASPMNHHRRHGACLGFLLGLAMTTTALVCAAQQAMGAAWT